MSLSSKQLKTVPILGNVVSELSALRGYLKAKSDLRENIKYKDAYKGTRCFIVANGPSLKDEDLTVLKNEHVFAVNNMMTTDTYKIIQPDFYVIADSNYFDEESKPLMKNMEILLNSDIKPICIFPYRFKKFVEKVGWNKKLEIIYVYPGAVKDKIDSIDFTSLIPNYENVVNVALFTAIYMGFTEIYLLGTDMTGFVYVYDRDGNIDDGGHFYKKKGEGKKFLFSKYASRSNENMLRAYSHVFKTFRLTNDYAKKRGIKIVNLSSRSALDMLERDSLKSVMK